MIARPGYSPIRGRVHFPIGLAYAAQQEVVGLHCSDRPSERRAEEYSACFERMIASVDVEQADDTHSSGIDLA